MSAHTPGPWKFMDIIGACSVHAGSRCLLSYDYSPDAENRANARLIAAAPELLEALKSILNEEGGITGRAGRDAVCANVRAAIAKAEGKT